MLVRTAAAPYEGVGSHDREREVDRVLVVLAPVELRDRRLGSEHAVAQVLREDPVAEEAHRLDLRVAPREPIADDGVVLAPVVTGEAHDAIELGAEQDRVGRGFLTALVTEQARRHRPPAVHLADDVLER